jgi:hypothetical protein
MAEDVGPQEFPNILDGIELWGIGRQGEQSDVVRDAQASAALVPAGAVEDQDGMGAGCYGSTDLGEVQVHQFAVDRGQH